MRYLDKGAKANHSEQHLAYAKKVLSREERWKIGASMVVIYRAVVQHYEKVWNGRSVGNAAICRGGTTRTMWVAKNDKEGIRRGQKLLRKAEVERLQALGVRFREVHYPKSKELMKALKDMAYTARDVHHPDQYGFVPQRDCVQSAAQHRYAKVVMFVDIKDAFDQVTHWDAVQILRQVFRVNQVAANGIADMMCHDWHLYQGNPMAPVMFNIRAMWLAERLHRLAAANGLRMTMYADDIVISSNRWEYMSKGFQRTVLRICAECGLKVNEGKVCVRRVSPYKIGHYDITGLVVDIDRETGVPCVRPLHRRRTIKKADYLQYLQARGLESSLELNRLGEPKQLRCVEQGLRLWANRQNEPPGNGQLELACG